MEILNIFLYIFSMNQIDSIMLGTSIHRGRNVILVRIYAIGKITDFSVEPSAYMLLLYTHFSFFCKIFKCLPKILTTEFYIL